MKNIITITAAAACRIKELLASKNGKYSGLKVSISTKGCSGFSYKVEYPDIINPHDETVTENGVTVYIDAKATLFLIGSIMDYENTIIKSGFVFKNPNEKGRCGCGESFTV